MVDVVDKATRSRMMSGIRNQDTRPEIALRKALHRLGLRYHLHVRDLPGHPDIVFPIKDVDLLNPLVRNLGTGTCRMLSPITAKSLKKYLAPI